MSIETADIVDEKLKYFFSSSFNCAIFFNYTRFVHNLFATQKTTHEVLHALFEGFIQGISYFILRNVCINIK